MNLERRAELLAIYRDGLLNDTLPFWLKHAVDRVHGGFMTALNDDGTIIDTDKGVWQQCRFTWLLAKLYNNVSPRDEWLELARHGAHFMDTKCVDESDGRMWFHVTRDGRPIRKRRYAFTESFAAIAYGELFKATGEEHFAEKARRRFSEFIHRNLSPAGVQGKYTDTRPMQGIGFPMIAIVTAQELRESIMLPEANACIDRSIETIRQDHVKDDLQCVLETVGKSGEFIDHFDGRTLNPGHAIEAAWFIMHEGFYRSDEDLIQLGCKILDWSWARGWDREYGGILYFVDVKGLPVQEYWHDMKFWWPQNETIIATLMAYQLTGDEKYSAWHRMIHDWTYTHFPDRRHGEWFGYLHRDGRISTRLKGNLWKGPFHLPRMQLKCWQILSRM